MQKTARFINSVEKKISIAFLLAMLLILSYQIILRFWFNASNSWSEEVARYIFVWYVYLSASYAAIEKAHIKIEAFINIYPKRVRKYIVYIGDAIFLVYCLVITYFGYLYYKSIDSAGQISLGTGIPMAWVYLAIPICHLLIAIRIVQVTVSDIIHNGEAAVDNNNSEGGAM